MAKLNLTLLAIFVSLHSNLALAEPNLANHNNPQTQTMSYIESSCKGTLYPDLCIRCLSKFANSTIDGPQQLAHVALSVSLSRALQTRGYLLKVTKELNEINNNDREYLTVQDCVSQINDSVDQLSEAIKELRRLNKGSFNNIDDDFLWHISNVETWVSTALTDASYCVESFPGHRMSKRVATVQVKAKNVAEVTSNALALFHRFASKYREEAAKARSTSKKP